MEQDPTQPGTRADLRELTLEEILALPCPKPTFPEQNADGVDLSLIHSNLQVSVEERVRRGDAGRYNMEEIRRHVRRR